MCIKYLNGKLHLLCCARLKLVIIREIEEREAFFSIKVAHTKCVSSWLLVEQQLLWKSELDYSCLLKCASDIFSGHSKWMIYQESKGLFHLNGPNNL